MARDRPPTRPGRLLRGARVLLRVATTVAILWWWGSPGWSGPPDPLDEVRAQIDGQRFAEAEARCREIRAWLLAESGGGTVREAQVIDALVEALWRGGKGAQAETLELATRAVTLKEQAPGGGDRDVALSLRNLGRVREIRGEIAEAVAIHERSIALLEASGGDPYEVGIGCVFLANVQMGAGRYAEAKRLFERALAVFEKSGPEKRVASTLHNLGLLNHETGDFETSRAYFERALVIKKQIYGPVHPDVAWTLNGLANLAEETGDFTRARALYEETLSMREGVLGPDHLHVAWSLNNLANLQMLMGEYASAQRLLERALEIERTVVGEDSRDAAATLLNLARLHRRTGDAAQALELQRQALQIRERLLPPQDPVLATTLHELAALYTEAGEYGEAEPLFARAIVIWQSAVAAGPPAEHGTAAERGLAWSENGLAGVLLDRGRLGAARRLYEQTLASRERMFGADHPDVAESLEGLALVLSRSGDLGSARDLDARVVRIRTAALGAEHPLTARAHRDLGVVLARMGDLPGALEAALASERIGSAHLRLTARALSDRQALQYATIRSSGLGLALSLAASGLEVGARRRVWESLMQSRAAVMDEMAARRHRLTRSVRDPAFAAAWDRLTAASQRLANLEVKGPDPQDPDRHYRLIGNALREKEKIEREIVASGAGADGERGPGGTTLAGLVRAIPADAAIVAYARYEPPDPPAAPAYLAFVARARDSAPRVVPLGSAQDVDRKVRAWLAAVTSGAAAAPARGQVPVDPSRDAGEVLRRAIWDRVAAETGRAERVFIVPDGILDLVNFSALPEGPSAYLVESGPTIHYLSAEREVLAHRGGAARGSGLLALGGAEFDAPMAPTPEAFAGAVAAPDTRPAAPASCAGFQDVRFPALPGSTLEAGEIADLWDRAQGRNGARAAGASVAIRLTGSDASEAAFKSRAPGRLVVHLATHGFYLDDACPSVSEGLRGIAGLAPMVEEGPPPAEGAGPLVLSGLALAGANNRQAAGVDREDGILTAGEIALLDLSGVEWVVLSACRTGVGETRTGEGVLGVRRSFQIAGARTLVMSLWPVEDEATRLWMLALYRSRLERRLDTAAAVRQASIEMLRRRRENHEPTDPLYWGAFVSSGDWR